MTEQKGDPGLLLESLARAARPDESHEGSFFGKGPTWANDPKILAKHEAQQGLYLAASGTLTQFNAVVAAILATALSSSDRPTIKISIAVALGLHLLASFLLCWAARPIDRSRSADPLAGYKNTDDTFVSYRRGWRITLLALSVSSVAALLFVLQTFGIEMTAMWSNYLPH